MHFDRQITTAIVMCMSLSACGNGGADAATYARAQTHENSEFDEDAARDQAAADINGQTFQDVGDTSRCTSDCSGHDAGFQWAQDNNVADTSDCSGSGSFEDGCEAYVEELDNRVEEARGDSNSDD